MTTFEPARILEVLEKHDIDYIVVGGIGGTLHGAPLLTDDLDIVPELKKTNLDSLAAALNSMNARLLSAEEPDGIKVDFTGKELQKWIVDLRFLQLLTDLGPLDIIHKPAATGGYRDLARNATELGIGEVDVWVAALEDIVRSKEAVGRSRDRMQLPTLRLLLEKKRSRGRGD